MVQGVRKAIGHANLSFKEVKAILYYVCAHLSTCSCYIQVKPLLWQACTSHFAHRKCTVVAARNSSVATKFILHRKYMEIFCEAISPLFTGQLNCFLFHCFWHLKGFMFICNSREVTIGGVVISWTMLVVHNRDRPKTSENPNKMHTKMNFQNYLQLFQTL